MEGCCAVCGVSSKAQCSACKKVNYCGKEHQKSHRKEHKADCYPAKVTIHSVLGHHLAASRDIAPGEKIFKEEPLIIG
jgi:hypothetical protein